MKSKRLCSLLFCYLSLLTTVASQVSTQRPELIVGTSHSLFIDSIAFSPDSRTLVTGGLTAILSHSISDRDLEEAFERIDAGQLLLIIDACNSGQALEAEEKRRGPMNSKGLAQLAYEKGMYVLTAAQSYQAAREVSRLGHGLLTYALIEEGLKRAKADTEPRDGQILIREWFGFAAEQVPRLQLEEMIKAQGNKLVKLRFLEEEDSSDPKQKSVQRPRMFYRREIERTPLIMARVEKAN